MNPLIDDKAIEKRYTQESFDRLDCPSTNSSDREENRLDTLLDFWKPAPSSPHPPPSFNQNRKKLKISDLCDPESPLNREFSHRPPTNLRSTKNSLQQPTQVKA